VRPKGQCFWTQSQCDIPLESDVYALEYLAAYNYEADKALFNLYCELSCGKGNFASHACNFKLIVFNCVCLFRFDTYRSNSSYGRTFCYYNDI
jgi:hypothetical protein